jgi:hypothetical protein
MREILNNREKLKEIICSHVPGASPYWAGKAADIMLAKGWILPDPKSTNEVPEERSRAAI